MSHFDATIHDWIITEVAQFSTSEKGHVVLLCLFTALCIFADALLAAAACDASAVLVLVRLTLWRVAGTGKTAEGQGERRMKMKGRRERRNVRHPLLP